MNELIILITVLAWISFFVSLIPNFYNLTVLFLGSFLTFTGQRNAFQGWKMSGWFFFWLAMGIWPIVYFFVK